MMARAGSVVALLGLLLLTACGSSPAGIVERYYASVEAGEIEEALSYMSPQWVGQWGTEKVRSALVQMNRQVAEKGGIDNVEILEETETGEVGTVQVKVTFGNGEEETQGFDLTKIDGEWKLEPQIQK